MRLSLLLAAVFLITIPQAARADDAWQLTTSGGTVPAWSPDGNMITFQGSLPSGFPLVCVIPATGGVPTPITEGESPAWSPDGSQIAYHSGGRVTQVYVTPSSGGWVPRWVAGGAQPCWSPDASQIAFNGSLWQIWIIHASGGVATQVTTDGGWSPAWSPDGTRIAFNSFQNGNYDIWVIPAAGGTATQITNDPNEDGNPAWSPDGTRIAFQSNRLRNDDIWVVRATGGAPIRITDGGGSYPAWSPDGNQIAFTRDGNIWIIDVSAIAVEPTTWGAIKASFKLAIHSEPRRRAGDAPWAGGGRMDGGPGQGILSRMEGLAVPFAAAPPTGIPTSYRCSTPSSGKTSHSSSQPPPTPAFSTMHRTARRWP